MMLSSSPSVHDDAAKEAVAGDVVMARVADNLYPERNFAVHLWRLADWAQVRRLDLVEQPTNQSWSMVEVAGWK